MIRFSKMQKSYTKSIYENSLRFLASLLGCVLTFYLWNYNDLNNILVNECLVLLYSLLFPFKHDDMFFSSALAGISPKKYLPNPGWVFLLATFVFLIFVGTKRIFVGYGGKYGTMGFFGNLLVVLFAYLNNDCDYPVYDFDFYKMLNWRIYVFGPVVTGISCLLSYVYYNYFNLTKHVAANVNGVLNSLLLLLIHEKPGFNGNLFYMTYGEIYNDFEQIGLLASLTKDEYLIKSEKKNEKEHLGLHYFIIGYLAGWIYIAVMPFLNLGGKNGFMAFLGNNVYVRISLLFKRKAESGNKHEKNLKRHNTQEQEGMMNIIMNNNNNEIKINLERNGSTQNTIIDGKLKAGNGNAPVDGLP